MRVALLLLLLLAIAAIPGSLVPQRSSDPNGVLQFEEDNPELFKVLDAFPIQAFDVYGSVWFSAIYLLLFISLIGCVLPRIVHHARALRTDPPRTPAKLQRMVGFVQQRVSNPSASAADREAYANRAINEARDLLRTMRYRVSVQTEERAGRTEVSVSAERGYLRETGNLLFHVALVGVLVSVAWGGLTLFSAQKVLVEGETMLNQLIDYDSASTSPYFSVTQLVPFSVRLDSFEVDYVTPEEGNPNALGQAEEFVANVTVIEPDGSERQEQIRVNDPLRLYQSPLYLLANGYAPLITVRNADGEVVYREALPFIPQDTNLTSLGVVKVPFGMQFEGADTQLGLRGFFYPSKAELDTGAFTSNYPDLTNPVLTLDVFVGDLGIDGGVPQSVYELDTTNMQQLTGRAIDVESLELVLGETVELPAGMGTVTFEAAPRYASFDVLRNPAQGWVLVFAVLSIAGLLASLFVPRRRLWVKAFATDTGVELQYAGLARGDDPTLGRAVEQLRARHLERL